MRWLWEILVRPSQVVCCMTLPLTSYTFRLRQRHAVWLFIATGWKATQWESFRSAEYVCCCIWPISEENLVKFMFSRKKHVGPCYTASRSSVLNHHACKNTNQRKDWRIQSANPRRPRDETRQEEDPWIKQVWMCKHKNKKAAYKEAMISQSTEIIGMLKKRLRCKICKFFYS